VLDNFERQAAWCEAAGAPFAARVLRLSGQWLAGEHAACAALAARSAQPLADALALRWLGALQHLALLGRDPWAGLWPPQAAPTDAALLNAITTVWQHERAHLDRALARAPQTNEVMRSAGLLPGLLHIAQKVQMPLHLAEIGASAGLNLWCDHYRHEPGPRPGPWAWGDAGAGLVLRTEWLGAAPPVHAPLHISRRAGCDAHPVDLRQSGEALRLASFVWADQAERRERLRQAIAVVLPRLHHAPVQALHAADFVHQQLASRQPGEALVLMHSVVWQYIDSAEQADIQAQMQAAAAAATPARPLAWLRFEPPAPDFAQELRATVWPGGEDVLLARCHPHGARIEWLLR
jgi:hypothetical protein